MEIAPLVARISQTEKVSRTRVAKVLYRLADDGTVRLQEAPRRSDFSHYFFSGRNLEFWALSSIPLITGLTMLGMQPNMPISLVRYILGSLIVLFLPGYGVLKTLYLREEMPWVQLLVFSLGLSLAIIPLVGVVLNYSPWGITLSGVFVSFLVIDLSLLFTAAVRQFAALPS